MSISQFEQFKDFLASAIQDTDFVRKNEILQDSAYLTNILNRVEALTADVSVEQDFSDFSSGMGLLLQDAANRTISFEPKGFETTQSTYREALVAEPRHLFKRETVADDIYYLLADGGISTNGQGVFLLNSQMEIVRRFPHFGSDIAGGEYEDPSCAITFTISSIEYVAITDATHDVVQIYLYASPYTKIATIGTIDTPGAAADLLTTPNGVAVDITNELIYISCAVGQPAGATASNGFVAVYDISTIGTPAFSSIDLFFSGTGSLLDAQVHTPVDLVYDDDSALLWVSNNGTNTVGAFNVAGASPVCTRFIEAAGAGYTLRGPQQLDFRTLTGGSQRLYIVNSDTGTVEEFNALTYQHLKTYGIRSSEDATPVAYQRLSPDVYGALGAPYGVVVDSVSIDDQDTNVMLVADPTNGRLQRFNLDAYTNDNYVNFVEQTFDVPVTFDSWNIAGDIPLDMVSVWYRFAQTETFREMPQEASLPSTSRVQFRLAVALDTRKFIRSDWNITKLRIHGKQA